MLVAGYLLRPKWKNIHFSGADIEREHELSPQSNHNESYKKLFFIAWKIEGFKRSRLITT